MRRGGSGERGEMIGLWEGDWRGEEAIKVKVNELDNVIECVCECGRMCV